MANEGLKKNLRIKLLTGQSLLVEGVSEWAMDAQGINITNEEVTKTKEGEGWREDRTVTKKWFNISAIITLTEEFVRV